MDVVFENLRLQTLSLINPKIISVPDDNTVPTLELIDDNISNLANAKNTVVGLIRNIFNALIPKYSRLSVTSFTYLMITRRRFVMVRRLR